MGSLGRIDGSVVSLGFAFVRSREPSGLRVHPGSRGFTRLRRRVIRSICVRVGSLKRAKMS